MVGHFKSVKYLETRNIRKVEVRQHETLHNQSSPNWNEGGCPFVNQ